jgi:hypothetical protein
VRDAANPKNNSGALWGACLLGGIRHHALHVTVPHDIDAKRLPAATPRGPTTPHQSFDGIGGTTFISNSSSVLPSRRGTA